MGEGGDLSIRSFDSFRTALLLLNVPLVNLPEEGGLEIGILAVMVHGMSSYVSKTRLQIEQVALHSM